MTMQPDPIHSDPLPDACLLALADARAKKIVADASVDRAVQIARLLSVYDGLVVVPTLYVVGGGK